MFRTEFQWKIQKAPKFLMPLGHSAAKKSKKRNGSGTGHSNVKFDLHIQPVNYVVGFLALLSDWFLMILKQTIV